MINFEGYYYIAAEEVASIRASTTADKSFPYEVTVLLKNGERHTVGYKGEKQQKDAARNLCNQVEMEMRQKNADIRTSLLILDDKIKRIDKRQLRIWQQLKRLLGLKDQGDET